MRKHSVIFSAIVVLLLSGCSNMSDTQQRVLSGAGVGVASGAVVTVLTGGCVECGAAIGGAVGAAAGYVVDIVNKNPDKRAVN